MPSDFAFKTMNTLHRAMRTVTFGKVGWKGYGMPVLELTTIGRKSGEPRTVLLTSPIAIDGNRVVVGSRGGTDVTPAWIHNIRANPEVTVTTKDGTSKHRARILTSEERAPVWADITKDFKNYAGYQEKTDREIPLVVLEPA